MKLKINRSLTIIIVMKAQLYGDRLPIWKSNQMWRSSRAKHIKRDIQNTQLMTEQIFAGQTMATYDKNSMIIRQATQRALKRV